MGRKWGEGHFAAWLRQGHKEIAQALPATPQSIRVVEEPGLAGNPTPQEVYQDKSEESSYDKWLNHRAHEAARESQPPEQGLER